MTTTTTQNEMTMKTKQEIEKLVIAQVKEHLTSIDLEQRYRDIIDETTPVVEIGGISFTPSRILEELDPIAFRCGVSDYFDDDVEEIDGDYYDKNEVEEIREEIQDKIDSKEESETN